MLLAKGHQTCETQTRALLAIMRQIDTHMRNACEALAEKHTDFLLFRNMGWNGCKRRVDEDFKKHVVETLLKERKVTNIGASAKVLCGLSKQSSACAWADKYVIERNIAARSHLQVQRVLGVTEDACKNGNPKEETNVYVVWDAHAKESTFGALQVVSFPIVAWKHVFSTTWKLY